MGLPAQIGQDAEGHNAPIHDTCHGVEQEGREWQGLGKSQSGGKNLRQDHDPATDNERQPEAVHCCLHSTCPHEGCEHVHRDKTTNLFNEQ